MNMKIIAAFRVFLSAKRILNYQRKKTEGDINL